MTLSTNLKPSRINTHAFSKIANVCIEDVKFSALLGFMVEVPGKSVTSLFSQIRLTVIVQWWRVNRSTGRSTLGDFAESLLSAKLSEIFEAKMSTADLHVRVALGFVLANRKSYSGCRMLLEGCIEEVEAFYSSASFEYGLIVAEIIKSCNGLKYEREGECWGHRAIRYRIAPNLVYRIDSLYIKIALADALIGQSEYEKAEAVLSDVLVGTFHSAYLTTTAALRLNKVRRRLGDTRALTLDRNSALCKAVKCMDCIGPVLKAECIEELTSTVNHLRQDSTFDNREARKIIRAAQNKISTDQFSRNDWHTNSLQRLDVALDADEESTDKSSLEELAKESEWSQEAVIGFEQYAAHEEEEILESFREPPATHESEDRGKDSPWLGEHILCIGLKLSPDLLVS
ncbi:hypothetical protein MMC14_004444 [Varicellaria rhodocarpa]|nr:hypothetical protein [Varicellaria rhodocarpa]